jgi:predicted CopG family antitoxin
MSDRKTLSVTEACYERLEAEKREDESWTDCLIRLADGADEQGPNTVAVENVDEIARASAQAVEDRLPGR